MKKIFQARYKSELIDQITGFLGKELPDFTGNGEGVIIELVGDFK